MPLRDDREALRARLDANVRELEEAQEELEDAKRREGASSAEAETLKKRVAALEKELQKSGRAPTNPRAPAANKSRSLLVGILAAVVLAGGAVFVFSMPDDDKPTAAAVAEQPQTPLVPAAPAPIARTFVFSARVELAQRLGLSVGQECRVEAESSIVGRDVEPREVRVRCGEQMLYRSSDASGAGVTMLDGSATLVPGPSASSARALLRWSDTGARSGGRPNLVIESWEERAIISDPSDPSSLIALAIAPFSEPVDFGAPVDPEATFRSSLRLEGHVTETNVEGLTSVGDACRVLVRPDVSGGFTCRVRVACGTNVLYGAGTSGMCRCDANEPLRIEETRVTSDDGDPALSVDLGERRVVITDRAGLAEQRITISLAER